jgi:hypothetical protein
MWQRRERENDSGERVLFATLVPEWGCEAYAEGCSDNSSIMRTVEHSMTNAVKRFVGRICSFAETRAPRPAREGDWKLRHFECLQL